MATVTQQDVYCRNYTENFTKFLRKALEIPI